VVATDPTPTASGEGRSNLDGSRRSGTWSFVGRPIATNHGDTTNRRDSGVVDVSTVDKARSGRPRQLSRKHGRLAGRDRRIWVTKADRWVRGPWFPKGGANIPPRGPDEIRILFNFVDEPDHLEGSCIHAAATNLRAGVGRSSFPKQGEAHPQRATAHVPADRNVLDVGSEVLRLGNLLRSGQKATGGPCRQHGSGAEKPRRHGPKARRVRGEEYGPVSDLLPTCCSRRVSLDGPGDEAVQVYGGAIARAGTLVPAPPLPPPLVLDQVHAAAESPRGRTAAVESKRRGRPRNRRDSSRRRRSNTWRIRPQLHCASNPRLPRAIRFRHLTPGRPVGAAAIAIAAVVVPVAGTRPHGASSHTRSRLLGHCEGRCADASI
jgi:hypothetical protein